MKALVTGSSGFIGTHLVKELRAKGHEVAEYDIDGGYDITAGVPRGKYDVIYHLAVLPLTRARDSPQLAVDVNIKGTVNVLECARRNHALVVFTSASSVYGDTYRQVMRSSDNYKTMHTIPIAEHTALTPVSIYGATKVAAEYMIQTYHTLYGIKYMIFRSTNVYGPGQKSGVIPTFIKLVSEGKPIIINGSGEQTRDFIYVGDMMRYFVEAATTPLHNRTINVGSGTETSINQIVQALQEIAGKKIEVTHKPQDEDERGAFKANLTLLESTFGRLPDTRFTDGLRKTWEATDGV